MINHKNKIDTSILKELRTVLEVLYGDETGESASWPLEFFGVKIEKRQYKDFYYEKEKHNKLV